MTQQPRKQGTVLVVDDDPRLRVWTTDILQCGGYTVREAGTAEEAIHLVNHEKFDAVVLKSVLPNAHRSAVMKAIHDAPANVATPILLTTTVRGRHIALGRRNQYILSGPETLLAAVEQARLNPDDRPLVADHGLSDTVEERLRQLSESMGEVFWVADANYHELLYLNKAYEGLWGRSVASAYADPWSFLEAVSPEDRERVLRHMEQARAGNNPGEIEFRVVHASGAVRHVLARIAGIRNENGDVYRITGVVVDITARREALARLEESETRFRRLAEASFDGIVVSAGGVIREVNRGFLDIYGYESDTEVIGRPVTDFVADESREDVLDHIATNSEVRYDATGLRKDGKRILLEIVGKAHTVDGQPARLTAIRDVTEKRSLEEQFRQAQKMEAVGRLAGGVAHDFNNMLTVITGHAELLLATMIPQDPRADGLQQIQKAAERAAALTRQLLAFSRQQVIEPRTVTLEDTVTRTKKMLERLIGEDIELVTHFADVPTKVRVDPGQLEQAIMNLAVNARDAMPTGGKLSIETQIVTFDDSKLSHHLDVKPGTFGLLAVTDSGTGMDAKTKARIFEPFFTTKEPGKGTGLGLASVYGVVKQTGGFINVYSEPGQGTCFKIYLPLASDEAAPEITLADLGSEPRGSETVLLVEDSDGVRDVARRVLQHNGYIVLEVANPLEALTMARRSNVAIDLLLTDVVMPLMSGRVLAERFREAQPNARVLYMSGYTDDAIVRHGVLNSGVPYLQKPFTAHRLSCKVREVLDAA